MHNPGIVTGNEVTPEKQILSPYRKGWQIVDFIKHYCPDDAVELGLDGYSRHVYAETHIARVNGTETLRGLIEAAVDPRHFLSGGMPLQPAVDYLNQYLKYDHLTLVEVAGRFRLRSAGDPMISVQAPLDPAVVGLHEFIQKMIEKSDDLMKESFYDGAITTAHTLMQSVLHDLAKRLDVKPKINPRNDAPPECFCILQMH